MNTMKPVLLWLYRQPPINKQRRVDQLLTIKWKMCTTCWFWKEHPDNVRALHSQLNRWTHTNMQCVYIYICCRVKTWSKIWVFSIKTWSKVGAKLGPRFVFACFSPILKCFGVSKNTQLVCRGAKIIFWQFVRISKEVFAQKCAPLVFVFLRWRKREHMKKWTRTISREIQKK